MTTELRDYGDGKTIVVYTDDSRIASRLKNRKKCFKVVPYEQEQYNKKRLAMVGMDLYFPQKERRRLVKLLGLGA